MRSYIPYFVKFVLILARACLFAGLFFACVIFGRYVTTFGLHFADYMFVCVLLTQCILLVTKVESPKELAIIMIYHVIWFAMEAFKVWVWSREYQDTWFFTALNVPLFSGFMYSAVGSFLFQWYKLLRLRFSHFPSFVHIIPIAILIYINFFTHHYLPDIRYILIVAICLVARRTVAHIIINKKHFSMPVLLWLFFCWFFLRVAENIATYLQVRVYPNQLWGRALVSFHKIIAWFLLFIVSTVIVLYAIYKWYGKDAIVYKE